MSYLSTIERETYRLVITRRAGTEILLSLHGSSWSLPSVEILSNQRFAHNLTEALHAERGLRAYCLFALNPPRSCQTPTSPAKYAVMEALTNAKMGPEGCQWRPVAGSGSRRVEPAEDNDAITDAVEKMTSHRNDSAAGPFARPGWIGELFEWAQARVDPLGLRVTGAIRQLNACATFSLVRLETSGPAVWFKATGDPNAHELPVSMSLARLFPQFVPKILGVHRPWNGWLAEEASGTLLHDCEGTPSWEQAARSLAELQLASIAHLSELLANRCKDFRLSTLVPLIEPFLARMDELMTRQAKRPPEPLTRSSLVFLAHELKEGCERLQELGLPDSLGHADFNPGNIILSPSRCWFLDWAEGCVTHPFITFEYLREHARRRFQCDDAVERITAAYLCLWQSVIFPDTIRKAMRISPLIACFITAISDTEWQSIDPQEAPAHAGYLRSLTRRMFREATAMAQRSEPCLR